MLSKLTAVAAVITVVTTVAVTVVLTACKHRRTPYPLYAIRDYPDSFQPWLTGAVNTGIVGYDSATRFIRRHATDEEISKLSQAENPILRAIALEEMTRRPSFNHQNVILTHLDDTAMIFYDRGEWGLEIKSVTDYIIYKGRWKTEAARDTIANEVVLHHDNLSAAYTACYFLPPRPEYHDHLIKMILRDRDYRHEIEFALYALAKYKRKEDIPAIKDILSTDEYQFTGSSFDLMKDYPDTAYLEVLQNYYPRRFYKTICRDQYMNIAESYFDALASYKTAGCANILTAILIRKPFLPCHADTLSLKERLLDAIWNSPCPAYATLRIRIAPEVRRRRIRDSLLTLQLDSSWISQPIIDTSAEPVRW